MSVFLVLQWSEAVTHSEVPKLRGSSGAWVWGLGVSNAHLKLKWLKKWALGSQVELQEVGTGTLCSSSPRRCPKAARTATAEIEGPLQLPDLELSRGLGDCQTCALTPSSFSLHTWQAVGRVPGNGFPTWPLSTSKLNRNHVVEFGSKVRLLFLLSPLLKKAGEELLYLQGWQECSWHSACAQHALHWPWALSHHRRCHCSCVSLTGQGKQTQHVLQFLLNWRQNLPHWKCHQALPSSALGFWRWKMSLNNL